MKTAYFNRFEISMSLSHAQMCSHQGDCSADVEVMLTNADIIKQLDEIGPQKIREELEEYGAWDDDELSDDDANRARIVWIAAGDIVEENIA